MNIIRIEVERMSTDKLSCKQWVFLLDGTTLWLDRYDELTRPTTRHKLRIVRTYKRFVHGFLQHWYIPRDKVEIPEDVKAEAIKYVVDCLKVKKWSER